MPLGGRQLSYARSLALCYEAGFRRGKLTRAVALMCAESARYVKAWHYNPGPPASTDRGLFQINDRWHPDLSDQDAYKARPNIAYAFKISWGGTSFIPWMAFTSGAYLKFVPIVLAARVFGRWKRYL